MPTSSRRDTSRWSVSTRRHSDRRLYQAPFETSFKMHRFLPRLATAEKIQKYLDDLPYNKEKEGETCRSPRLVVEYQTAHCFEGALFAAAALLANGKPPLILDLASVRDDDHVIAVYRTNGYWGAI